MLTVKQEQMKKLISTKTVLIIGPSQTGKTSLINLYKSKEEEKCQVGKQGVGQSITKNTQMIGPLQINQCNYFFIDSPGFGDSELIEDYDIVAGIFNTLLVFSIQYIDAIIITEPLTSNSNNQLFKSLVFAESLFPNIFESIIVLGTFADLDQKQFQKRYESIQDVLNQKSIKFIKWQNYSTINGELSPLTQEIFEKQNGELEKNINNCLPYSLSILAKQRNIILNKVQRFLEQKKQIKDGEKESQFLINIGNIFKNISFTGYTATASIGLAALGGEEAAAASAFIATLTASAMPAITMLAISTLFLASGITSWKYGTSCQEKIQILRGLLDFNEEEEDAFNLEIKKIIIDQIKKFKENKKIQKKKIKAKNDF